MRKSLLGMAVLSGLLPGCMVTEPMSTAEVLKYSRGSPELMAKSDGGAVRPPKPETCLEAGKMYEVLAKTTEETAQKREFSWRAKQAYQQALKLRPGWAAAYAGLARVEENEGNPHNATAYFQQTLQQASLVADPGNAAFCHEAGLFFARLKQYDQSIAAMQQAVQLDSSNRTYSMNYGFTLARAGKYDDGYQFFCRIMTPSDAAYHMAQMAQHVGDVERSRQYAGFALQQNPSNASARQLLVVLDGAGQQLQQAEHTEQAPQ